MEQNVAGHNHTPKPLIRTEAGSDRIEKIQRARKKLDKLMFV